MDDGSWIVFWIFIGAAVGGVIGASRNNVGSGVIWGALLGPIGWILVLFLDQRAKCPECQGSLPEDAHRCQHCGFELRASKPNLSSSEPRVAPIEPDKKKCPFCAELIQMEAIKCRFCGSDLVKPPAKTETEQPLQKEKPLEQKLATNRVNFGMAAFPDAARIPCPLCGQRIRVSELKQDENFCPHCFEKFVAE